MLRYEMLMLAVPEITQDESKQLEDQLEKLIEKHKGAIISFERWGKFRLAYPVNNNNYGIYFLLRFEIEKDVQPLLEELKTLFAVKLNDIIMRYMLTKLDPEASLAYQRPQSLEDTPGRAVDSFLREHQMEGLLSIDTKKEKQEKKAELKIEEEIQPKPLESPEKKEEEAKVMVGDVCDLEGHCL